MEDKGLGPQVKNMQINSELFRWLVELAMPQETETYRMEKPNPIDEMDTSFFGSEKATITNRYAGNEVEQSAVETTGSKEHVCLADVHKVR